MMLRFSELKQSTFTRQFLQGRDLGSGVAGWPWPTALQEAAVRAEARAAVLGGLTGLPRRGTHMAAEGMDAHRAGFFLTPSS